MSEIFHRWQHITELANNNFMRGHFRKALLHYRYARDLSLDHINCWPSANDAVTAIVVSFVNLAEALAQTRRLREAAENLCLVHQNLLLASLDPAQPQCLRQAALDNLPRTVAALQDFALRHGHHPLIKHAQQLTERLKYREPRQTQDTRVLH